MPNLDITGKIAVAGLTDPGLVRKNNEDAIAHDFERGILLLADGMGGYSGGEIASAIAINTVHERLRESLSQLKDIGEVDESSGFTHESLSAKEAIELANQTILQAADAQPQYKGMGTTIVLVILYDNRVTIAHVGDSRLYRARDGQLEQVTRDHSLLRDLVDKGFYTEEEAKASLNKNVLTRALGIDKEVQVDVQEDVALPGDLFLLCSDGLTDMVEDNEIFSTIQAESEDLSVLADRLVALAKEHGGRDNVSVLLARVDKDFALKRRWFERMLDWFF